MRTLPLLLLAASLTRPAAAAPKVADMLPGKAVLSAAQRAAFDDPPPSGVAYTGAPQVAFPVVPLQIFGLRYAVDIVLVSTHPDWDMHEYARIDLPGRSFWIAKDANHALVQTIVSDQPDLKGWLPEIPVDRIEGPLKVEDRSQGDHIDVTLAYTNPAGDPVEVSYQGRMTRKPPGKRNGSTMGHSRQMAAVVLDLARFGHGGQGKISIGGKPYPLDRLFGFYPQKYLLDQTQGGIAITRFVQSPSDGGFRLERPGDAEPWPTHGDETWTVATQDGVTFAHEDNAVTALTYRFRDGELIGAEVSQLGEPNPVFSLALDRALPDLSRPFTGTATCHFAFDIHGQRGHGTGELRAFWEGDHPVVEMVPTAPRWLTDRPMRGEVHFPGDGSAHVAMSRTDP